MKRLFFFFSLLAASFFTSSYAADNTASAAMQSFQTAFYGAKDIQWEQVGVLSKATFQLNGMYRSVFYNSDGELIAETQNVPTTSLPAALQASLKKELDGRWITEAFIVNVEGAKTYYVTLENADTTVMLRSADAKKWIVYQKMDK